MDFVNTDQPDRSGEIPAISVPTLVLRSASMDGQHFTRDIAGSIEKVHPEGGHLLPEEDPPVGHRGDPRVPDFPAAERGEPMKYFSGDAYNLGWKLAQVLAGADDRLLDTYETERQPIAAGVLGLSTRKYEGLGKLDPSSIRRGKDEKQLSLTYHGGPLAATEKDRTATLCVGDQSAI